MTDKVMSLRMRLFLLILAPLLLVALLLGYWRYTVAQRTAEDVFDRALLSAGLAISRDVAISGGDALSRTTRDVIEDAAGGELFYHVTGPGGIYVTGYAYPPRVTGDASTSTPIFALANYRGEQVRVLKMTERTTTGNLSGDMTVTVWQRIGEREQLAQQLALRAAALMATLLFALALVVWFGVHRGLRPLLDLHDAIALRSPDDLSRIKRPLPVEVKGIVATLNRLFGQVETSIAAHQVFISDAAHQLRNPAAAVLSLAETLDDADDPKIRKQRTDELIEAARASARLANQLLSLERLRHNDGQERRERFDLHALTEEVCATLGSAVLKRGLDFELKATARELPIFADRTLVAEAIGNLIDNALHHGGPALRSITVETNVQADMALVTVADDGKPLRPEDAEIVLRRFGQLETSNGSGLGLSIVSSVAENHGGRLQINDVPQGASLSLWLPVRDDP